MASPISPAARARLVASSFFHPSPPASPGGSGSAGAPIPERQNFFNPYLRGSGRAPAGRGGRGGRTEAAGGRRPPPRGAYHASWGDNFAFIAPRCLDEDAPEDRRCGIHDGRLARAPRVYCGGEERDILDPDPAGSFWPRRMRMWGDADSAPPDLDPRFEAFHVYDIVETTEAARDPGAARLHGRFLESVTPTGTVVTLLGTADNGLRVAVHVYGVRPYFYMNKADADAALRCRTPRELGERMADALRGAVAASFPGVSADWFEIDVVERADVYYYETPRVPYYRVRVGSGRAAAYLCDNFCPGVRKYEGGVDATTRLVLDNDGFVTFGWYRLRPGAGGARVQLRDPADFATSSDVEVNCTADNLACEPDRQGLPDYKLMCFDIECKAGGADELAFPVADHREDLVIQISCLLYAVPTHRLEHVLLFSLGSCDLPEAFLASARERGLPAPVVLEFDSEFELLLAFFTFLKQYAPEFATGYNIVNFDWPFLATKMTSVYEVQLGGYGRLNTRGTFRIWDIGSNHFQKRSKAKITGVVNIDMYAIVREKVKLSSYKLGAVAEAVLGDRKKDLEYRDIPRFYAAGPDLRGVIGEYCIQDSLLVGQLFFKYLPHLELAAVAQLAGINLVRAVYDGQQVRVYTCLLRLAGRRGFVLPDTPGRFGQATGRPPGGGGFPGDDPLWEPGADEAADDDEGEEAGGEEAEAATEARGAPGPKKEGGGGRQVGYQGATVLEPETGFHVHPVVVFDFASLYPSIIQAHNLCLSTLSLRPEAVGHLRPGDDYLAVEVGARRFFFVKAHVRESLLSVLLRDWLAMRKSIRARIPQSAPEEAVLLDKQQAAIKVVCNSVYGFTGVRQGLLPCLPVAATVTTIGRDMLLSTREYVHARWAAREALEADFPEAAGMRTGEGYSARIIYGDTDSIFVLCRGLSAQGLTEMGDRMASHISRALFPPPIKLECEKTFTKLLLITKKKYIGLVHGGKMLIKGVDLVRKNNCAFINRTSRALVDLLFHDDAVSRAAASLAERAPEEWLARPLPEGLGAFGAVLVDAHRRIADPGLDVDDFVLTAELSRPPEAYANKRLPHLTVYRKLLARREQVPSVKDRIPYVIVAQTRAVEEEAEAAAPAPPPAAAQPPSGDGCASPGRLRPPEAPPGGSAAAKRRKLLVSELAEHPAHAAAHGIPLNTDYYFSHLLGAASVTFKALFGNNTRITENLFKRFIPEVWHPEAELAARLRGAGFARAGAGLTEEETRRRLRRAFDTLA
ncbi:DNA polymerase catalytic subunit [Ateline alphaherpesvirus 1]|uniref:DNA polymerase n=1 Tax=Herpesvirus ateles type 1 (strain Lennette) TaxID=35243 RepID=A0A1S6JLN1_HSVA1|nr:DNA polymerase catalytic subunit [Ateline alphaherpesvirus 1]AQS79185.1 DNA polymerase catalytic subunit [Ateline alphaherpesvirus 1]